MIPGSEYVLAGMFGLIIATTVGGALLAVLATRVIRSVTGLAICAVGLAGLYAFLHSPFLALMEILIYVGAVCVTIMFGVMLTETDEPAPTGSRQREAVWGGAAILIGAVVFGGVVRLGLSGAWPAAAERVSDGSVQAIGVLLLTTYSLPFELISLVLLVAILGALVIARGGRGPS